jgi:hypothetical protein
MTWEINREYFDGKKEVTCNTCHNGRPHPLSTPNLTPGQPVERRPKQPASRPTVDQILEKYRQAVSSPRGSKGANENLYIRAIRIEPDGAKEKEEIWHKPGKLVISTFYPPNYTVTEGYDGINAWKKSNADLITLKPDEAEQIRRTAQLFAQPDLRLVFPKLEYERLEKIEGREVYVLRAVSDIGTPERLFFNAKSGLLVRRTASTMTILGAFVYQVDYNDYKAFGGVKVPFTSRVSVPGISFIRKILNAKTGPTANRDVVFKRDRQ